MTAIAFCSGGVAMRPELSFKEEGEAARAAGFEVLAIDHDAAEQGEAEKVARHLQKQPGVVPTIFHGWMLNPAGYSTLYQALDRLGYRLINSPREYTLCHHLPHCLQALGDATPETWFVPWDGSGPAPIDELLDMAGSGPAIVKDYAKSEKHMWAKACFIPDVADRSAAREVISNFVLVRGPFLEGGLVLRRFEPLKQIASPDVGGLPRVAEWRTWWLNGRMFLSSPNHEVPNGMTLPPFPQEFVAGVAAKIRSNFFTLDVALRDDGEWRIIEPGDGQVAGVPPSVSHKTFYEALAMAVELGKSDD